MSAVAPSQPTIPGPDPGWIQSPLYRMTVEQYEAMVESGVLESRNRFHLINGYLVAKLTQNPPHAVADEALVRVLPADGYRSRAAKPVRLPAGTASLSPIAASPGGCSSITRITTRARARSPSSWRSPIRASRSTASWRRKSTGPPESRSTGSST